MPSLTDAAKREAANALWKDLNPLMSRLHSRWSCESAHEDIAEYGKVIASKIMPKGAKLIKMHKRPFGFIFGLNDRQYKVAMTSREYTYKRVA